MTRSLPSHPTTAEPAAPAKRDTRGTPGRGWPLQGLFCIVAGGLLLAGQAFATPHGRFLPDEDATTPVREYGQAMPTAFDMDVLDPQKGIKVGQIKFDYDTYLGDEDDTLGAALAGAFYLADIPHLKVMPGYSLGWVQTVTTKFTGSNALSEWNLPAMDAGEYPDAPPADPRYPFASLPTGVPGAPGMTPTLPFQDFPARLFSDGEQRWLAELGLVAISDTPNIEMMGMQFREVRVISTFLWGFEIKLNATAGRDIGDVMALAPSHFGMPTQSYLDTLNGFYDGMGGGSPMVASSKYKFVKGLMAFVVGEPGTWSLFLVAAVGIVLPMRRRRRA